MYVVSCISVVLFVAWLAAGVTAQTVGPPPTMPAADNSIEETMPKSMREMMQKQRLKKEQREHDEMLKRGETANQLANELHTAFSNNNALTNVEQKKLEQLEKLVLRIRKDLGGGSDDKDKEIEEKTPSTVKETLDFLKSTTSNLFDELKKTSRFTISAAAIQSTNSIIRLARLLRFRR